MDESNGSNITVSFTCALPSELLSRNNITNDSFWTINEYNILGQPVPDVLKVLYIIFLTIVSLMLLRERSKLKVDCLLLNKVFFSYYIICGISLVFTVLLFGVLPQINPSGEFFYGSSDTTRCAVCEFAGFLFIFFNSLALHCYACWYSIILWLLFSDTTFTPRLKTHYRITTSSLILASFISFWVAIPPIFGFGRFEFDRDLGLCLPRVTGESHRGIENRSYITFLAIESLIPVIICFAMLIGHLCLSVKEYFEQSNSLPLHNVFGYGFGVFLWMISLFIMLSLIPETSSQISYVYCWLFYMMSFLLQAMSLVYSLHK